MKASRVIPLLVVLLLLVPVLSIQAQDQATGTTTTKVLVRGAPVQGTNGLAVDDQGRLHIASAIGREIVVMDSQTGKILETYGPEVGVDGPDDLIFAPDGSLYWTDILSGEVGRMTPDGVVKKQFVAPFVNPIAMSDDGRLFVAQAFVADGLFELDPELQAAPLETPGVGPLNGMDFGPDGLLYAPRGEEIVRIDVDTAAVEALTDEIEGACKFDSQGRLHVIDDDRVVLFEPDSGEITTVATLPNNGGDNIVFDAEDTLFISNFRDGSIHTILPSGEVRLISRGGMIIPGGIAVLPDSHAGESIFVADFWTVRGFDGLNGRPGLSGRDFFFDSPFTASADGDNLVLTSWFGNTVEVWNPATQAILEAHFFNVPLNAMRFQGNLVVSELGTGSVVRLDAGSNLRTPLATGLYVPSGLAAMGDNLWVADWATGIVWQIVADGVTLDPPHLTAAGLALPEGLAVDHDGSLLVVESGIGRLSRVDTDTGTVHTVVENLALGSAPPDGWPPTWIFSDVAVGEGDAIYVTGDVGNVIYRIEVRP
jgi:sugar lactone lactonase YvrE